MKKVLFSVAVATAFAFTSCGGGDYCGCIKDATKMATEAGADADKAKAAGEAALKCAEMLPKDAAEAAAVLEKCGN